VSQRESIWANYDLLSGLWSEVEDDDALPDNFSFELGLSELLLDDRVASFLVDAAALPSACKSQKISKTSAFNGPGRMRYSVKGIS